MHTPSSTTSSLVGDYIGTESCMDFKKDEDTPRINIHSPKMHRRGRGKIVNYNEYPPPIPWLARTGNLPSHMPWVYKKYYTEDGRLVIREEKVRHHEFIRAVRSNGRLILNLVPLDDVDVEDRVVEDDDDEVEDDENDEVEDRTVEDEVVGSIGVEGKNGKSSGKCVEYKNMRTSTCSMFGMQVPPFPPIRI